MARKEYTTRIVSPGELAEMSDDQVDMARTVVVGDVSASTTSGTNIDGVQVDVRRQGARYTSVRICPPYRFPNRIAAKRFLMLMGYVELFEYVSDAA